MKDVILFDFFGVLCAEVSPRWFRKYYPDAQAGEIKAEIMGKADLGILTEDETYEQISRRTGAQLVKINTELADFVGQQRHRHKVYLLSNAISPFLRRILEEYGLYDLFDGIIISSEIGLAKPSAEFFNAALERLGVRPEDAVMIDDNAANIAGAERAGIRGIVFESNRQLFAAWERLMN